MRDVLSSLLGHDIEVFQQREERRLELGRDIFAASYLTEEFTAEDGRSSRYLFRPELFMTKPTVLRRLVNVLADSVPSGVHRLAATEPGSLPIAAALSLEIGLPFVALREEKSGEGFTIRGEVHAGERIVVLEDVSATGRRALAAGRAVQETGAELDRVICVIDREEGARARLAEVSVVFSPLFKVSELLNDPMGPTSTDATRPATGEYP